jgi:hypothetical protein
MTNIAPQSTQETDDAPTSPSEPRRLELGGKSKGCPTPEPTGKDKQHHTKDDSDLPGSFLSKADQMMNTVYGDHVHQNPGTHLTGGIADDAIWQEHWLQLVSFPSHAYGLPSGAVGKRFVERAAEELKGVKSRKWNSEKFIVFQLVVLQQSRDVKRSRDVRRQISRRLDAWEKGQFTMLVEDTLRSMEAHLSHKQGTTTPEQRTKTFHQKVLHGNLRGAVRYLTERQKGGILYPDNINKKTGCTVQSVLESKHPDARTPSVNALTNYPSLPDFMDLDITEDSIEITARPHPEAQDWEGRKTTSFSNGCCALGNPAGSSVKPPPIWWTGLPIPSCHGLHIVPSWQDT